MAGPASTCISAVNSLATEWRGLEALDALAEGPGKPLLPPTEGLANPLRPSHSLCTGGPSFSLARAARECCDLLEATFLLPNLPCHGGGEEVYIKAGWLGQFSPFFQEPSSSWSIPEQANTNCDISPAPLRLLAHVSPDGPAGNDHQQARTQI